MIDLYYGKTGNSFRAAIALEECGLPFERHKLDLSQNEHKSEEILKLNPVGAVPIIVDHDGPNSEPITLTQSGAIMLYAAERAGQFIPSNSQLRYKTMKWFMAAVCDAAPGNAMVVYSDTIAPDKSAANRAWLEDRLLNVLQAFNDRIGDNEYIVEDISIADLALYPVVNMRRELLAAKGGFDILLAWADRIAERPAVVRAMEF